MIFGVSCSCTRAYRNPKAQQRKCQRAAVMTEPETHVMRKRTAPSARSTVYTSRPRRNEVEGGVFADNDVGGNCRARIFASICANLTLLSALRVRMGHVTIFAVRGVGQQPPRQQHRQCEQTRCDLPPVAVCRTHRGPVNCPIGVRAVRRGEAPGWTNGFQKT